MKGIFIISEALYDHSGISKKILAQVSSFKENGVEMDLSFLEANSEKKYISRNVGETEIERFSEISAFNKWEWRTKFKTLTRRILIDEYDFVYIRYTHFANPFFISFLKELKKNKIKILLEIPTFPYDMEYQKVSFKHKLLLSMEKVCRKKFSLYVDRIITFSDFDRIFDVPTIKISNGVDLKNIKVAKTKPSLDTIHTIGVASMNFWHGFDRFIEGMNIYYNKLKHTKKIIFHIVGDTSSPEAQKYILLVNRYGLKDVVIFHGKKFGGDLDDIFTKVHLGVGCLGCHRKGIKYIKSIKNREYCARGIPFIYSEIDSDFDHEPFVLKAPADESPIDISMIICELENNKFNQNEIRNYAVQNLSWNSQMAAVIGDLNSISN